MATGGYMLPEMNSEAFYDDLQQNAVLHGKDGSNSDCLFFYSTGTVKWAYDASKKMLCISRILIPTIHFYFLTDDGAGLSVQEEVKPATNPGKQLAEYDFHARHESDEVNHINSGTSWYGDRHLLASLAGLLCFQFPT